METLLPMYHLDKAGFALDVATVSDNPVKFEFWAMPLEDDEVTRFFDRQHSQFKQPLKLADVLAADLDGYAAIFIPGRHGALIGIPESPPMTTSARFRTANARCWPGLTPVADRSRSPRSSASPSGRSKTTCGASASASV